MCIMFKTKIRNGSLYSEHLKKWEEMVTGTQEGRRIIKYIKRHKKWLIKYVNVSISYCSL